MKKLSIKKTARQILFLFLLVDIIALGTITDRVLLHHLIALYLANELRDLG